MPFFKYFFLSALFLLLVSAVGQQKLSEGARVLFKNSKTSLPVRAKNDVFEKTGFVLTPDKKQFLISNDSSAAAFPFKAGVYPTDINQDGIEEIFLVFGNEYTSGKTGTNILLFINDRAGSYQSNFGFSGGMPVLLPTKHLGYPDLLIGGPGTIFPVWKWNGKEYEFYKTLQQQQLKKLKTVTVASASLFYTSTVR